MSGLTSVTFFTSTPHASDRYLMRELERPSSEPPCARPSTTVRRVAIVGRGRLGTALSRALAERGVDVVGPLARGQAPPASADPTAARGEAPSALDAILLCVPDGEIAAAAAAIAAGVPVGHCSGATGLEPLAGHEAFSIHPLMTLAGGEGAASFVGAGAAIAGATPRALELARALALTLAMAPIEIDPDDRAAYHAAASIASNFLITLEAVAERLAASVGVERAALVPLVRATVENWAEMGPERALTGPVARGDDVTVARQRGAVAERAPELLALFDALVDATRELASDAAVAR